MEKFFKWGALVSLVILFISSSVSIGWFHWWYPRNYEYPLILADDSSIPNQKAEFLFEYLKIVDEIKGPPRYIFMRPDLRLDVQKRILYGLVTRFQELAKLKQSEMAYQQGMQQLTRQEMDHQLSRISGIFKSAKLRESISLFFLIVVLPAIFAPVTVFFLIVWGATV